MKRTKASLFLSVIMAFTSCEQPRTPAEAAVPQARTAEQEPAWQVAALSDPIGSTPLDAAVRQAQSRVRQEPANASAWTSLGEAWVRKARRDQAPQLYTVANAIAQHALSLSPENAPAIHLTALVARQNHEFDRMRVLAAERVERDPKDVRAWGLLGDAHLELGSYDEALEAYQRMMDLHPSIPAFARVAYVRWLHGDTRGAQEMWEECAKAGAASDPEPLAYCLTEAGHVDWHRNQPEKARKLYGAALQLLPDYAAALFGVGRLEYALGNYEAAASHLRESLRQRRSEETYVWLAATLRKVGDLEEATKMEQELVSASQHDDSRTISLYLTSRNLEASRALELAQKDAKQRKDVFTHDALAMAYFRSGDLEAANRHIDRAVALGTPDARLYAHAGLIAAAREQHDVAREQLRAALAMNPSFDPYLVDEVREVLLELEQVQ